MSLGTAEGGDGEAREQFPVGHNIVLKFAWSGNHLPVWTLVSSLKTKTRRNSVLRQSKVLDYSLTT